MNKSMKIRTAVTTLVLAASTLAFTSESSTASGLANIIADPVRLGTIAVTPTSGQVAVNEVVSIKVDFPTSGTGYSNFPLLTLQHDGGTGAWVAVAGQTEKKSTSAGIYTFSYPVPVTEKVRVVAKETATYAADTLTPVKQFTVVPSSAVLDAIPADGKSATAHFTPISSGRATQLQVQEIYTSETSETDAVLPLPPKKGDYVGPWKTIASSTQNSVGNTTFSISNPLEVKHKYRAVSGATSNEVQFASPLPSKSTGLPQLHFNTYEGDTVNSRTRYFEGEFVMKGGSKVPECAEVAPITKSTMKGRGNYSWSFEKKGYTLKIDKKTNLCGMGISKKWALIANHYDKSLMRNMVAYNIGQKFTNLAWTPKTKPVDFYMNGSYLGTYMLVERIAIQGSVTNAYEDPANTYSPRVDIDELKADGQTTNPAHPNNTDPNITGGYVLEWDFRKGADYNPTVGSRGYVGVKDPENDLDREGKVTNQGISSQQKTYINKYVDEADAALFGSKFTSTTSGWRKYIDEDSAVDYYLAMELLKPVDGNMWASVYMYKPRGGKLEFGPMWDFDLGLGSANRAGNVAGTSGWYLRNVLNISAKQSTKTWFNRLNEDSSFRAKVAARWKVLYPSLSSSSYIDQQKGIMAASAAENYKRWSYSKRISKYQVFKSSWSADANYVKTWMNNRRAWMNGQY